MQGAPLLLPSVILALACSFAAASDPDPVQDFCVALNDTKTVFVNGKFCKDPKLADAGDFFFSGLDKPGNTSNPVGSKVTPVTVDQIPGLNTLGISLARIDFAPYGLNPAHTHPRATEILVVVEGTLEVGFVTSNQQDGSNKLFTKILNKGDVFVFPVGLIHFQFNRGHYNALAFAGLSSQNPGVITIANAVFGSDPHINPDVLTKAFQVDKNIIDYLQKQFWSDNKSRRLRTYGEVLQRAQILENDDAMPMKAESKERGRSPSWKRTWDKNNK
nr:germin-like protein subfamily 1 member 16 [Ziziphus jujuba var. spinosa]